MSSGKWNFAWWISEEFATMKLILFMVPLFVVTVIVSIKGPPDLCRWGFVTKKCSASSYLSPLPSNSSFETTLHPHHETEVLNVSKPSLNLPYKDENKVLNVSKPWLSLPYVNEPSEHHLRQEQKRNLSVLDKTEIGLAQARSAIREARNGNRTQDSEYVLTDSIYWNAKAFHRSYLEMEKKFKVFVYGEGEPRISHNAPCKSIYSMEGNFRHAIEMNDHFRTRDPEKAHVFFLPFSVAVRYGYSPMRKTVTDYVKVIAERYPYWNRSLGADHFTIACHDMCGGTSSASPYPRKNSIRVLCNANTSEGFRPAKDVSFPEINLKTGSMNSLVGGPSAFKRSILAFFSGGAHGPIRQVLLKHWENKDEDIQIHRYLQKGFSYYEMMRKSKFCLCPSGYEVTTPRVVEAIYSGCVPVLISEHYVPPFSDVLNWKSFSLELSVKDIPNLKGILMSIPPRQYMRMQRRVEEIRRHFEVHSPPKRFDVFHMILHSVWLRRLNFEVHDDQRVVSES